MFNNAQFTSEHVQKSNTYFMNNLQSGAADLFTNGRF